jgi:hypothetical protein
LKVHAEQFELGGDNLTHRPIGAEFWTNDKEAVLCDEGAAVKPASRGNDYDPQELKHMAWESSSNT